MGKPTEEELKIALEHAATLREQGEDQHHMAKALLNYDYRFKALEKVLHAAEHFLRSGMSATEHQNLVKAINEFHRADRRSGGEDDDSVSVY